MHRRAWLLVLLIPALALAKVRLVKLPDKSPDGMIEIRGVSADTFDSDLWTNGKPNLVPDIRHPLLEPRPGHFRNIYAPSILVDPAGGWRIFYGGWDGVATGNDRIYSAHTNDFLTFDDRRTVIDHGPFQHVCNVSALRINDTQTALMCTAFPDAHGLNKPAFFSVQLEPRDADRSDLIIMTGYPAFEAADINGTNVLLRENAKYRLYFNNFRDPGKVFRATSDDGRTYKFDAIALSAQGLVNDVKMFHVGQKTFYLMALHHNGPTLTYSLSTDGLNFSPPRKLLHAQDERDKHIVSVGWVTREEKLLGLLYGAGAAPTLDANRIFARWLQKEIVWVQHEKRIDPKGALGPDAAIFQISGKGKLEVDRETFELNVNPGDAFQLTGS